MLVWICETGSLTVSSSKYSHGRALIEQVTGSTPHINKYPDFGFYDWVIYRADAGLSESSIVQWLGVSHKVGQFMFYLILTVRGVVISYTNVQRLTNIEQQIGKWKENMYEYTTMLNICLSIEDTSVQLGHDINNRNQLSMIDQEDQYFINEYKRVIDDKTLPHMDKVDMTQKDTYLHIELGLPRGSDENFIHAVVKKRIVD